MATPARYQVRDDVLPAAEVAALARDILQSRALGENPLAGTFANTRGFGLLFRASEREALCERHVWARRFLAHALAADAREYACYLNALLVPPGGAVGLHRDGTLQEALGSPDAPPERVTVLYLAPGDGAGGELVLAPPGEPAVCITPRAARLVSFAGDLPHEIRRRDPGARRPRLSLVLERYQPPVSALRSFSPRLEPAEPVVDVSELFAGGRGRPFDALVPPREASEALRAARPQAMLAGRDE